MFRHLLPFACDPENTILACRALVVMQERSKKSLKFIPVAAGQLWRMLRKQDPEAAAFAWQAVELDPAAVAG